MKVGLVKAMHTFLLSCFGFPVFRCGYQEKGCLERDGVESMHEPLAGTISEQARNNGFMSEAP